MPLNLQSSAFSLQPLFRALAFDIKALFRGHIKAIFEEEVQKDVGGPPIARHRGALRFHRQMKCLLDGSDIFHPLRIKEDPVDIALTMNRSAQKFLLKPE